MEGSVQYTRGEQSVISRRRPAATLSRSASLRAWLVAGALVAGALAPACGNRETLGVSAMSVVSAGVLNDPANKTLRFELLTYGMDRFCVEMRRRGAPLKLADHEPVLGRFFADGCSSQIIDGAGRQSVVVRFSGTGYGHTPLTGRLGFRSDGLVEYAADFQLSAGSMYIYFRPRSVGQATFEPLLIESALVRAGLGAAGVDARAIGKDIIERQLARGFTVIRKSETGEVEFSPGLIPLGERPFRPYNVVRSDKITLDNDRTEVHAGQQDYIGGVQVAEHDRRLYLHLSIDGAPAVDVFLLPEAAGQSMVQTYVIRPGPAQLPSPPALDMSVSAGQPAQLALDVPAGRYFLVFDHSAEVGRSAPAQGQQAAKIDYLVQVGER